MLKKTIALVMLGLPLLSKSYPVFEHLSLKQMILQSDRIFVGVNVGSFKYETSLISNISVVHNLKGEASDIISFTKYKGMPQPKVDCCDENVAYLFFTKFRSSEFADYSNLPFNGEMSTYKISKGQVINFEGENKPIFEVVSYIKSIMSNASPSGDM